jgi:putative hydrolase of the HAD superfamily
MIKHITIDLWLTLIRSHPSYKKERVMNVFRILHGLGYKGTPDRIKDAIEVVDNYHTMVCEKTGFHNMTQRDLWFMVLHQLDIHNRITLEDVDSIITKCNELFILYPPEYIEPDTLEILREVADMDITIDIISNTGFITGTTVRRALLNRTIGRVIRSMYFSDAQVYAKPNFQLFMTSLASVRLNHGAGLKPEHILHVGDNMITDIKGAKMAGFQTFWINCGPEGGKLNQLPDHIKKLNA